MYLQINKQNLQKINNDIIQNKIINFKNIMEKYNYLPNSDNPLLLLFATHIDTKLKLNTVLNNLKYLSLPNIKIIIINSINLPFNSTIYDYCKKHDITYYEIPNTLTIDSGKFLYALKKTDYSFYKYIIFTNDSFIIHSSIQHFINLVVKTDKDIYAYSDSNEYAHHYQSYLFAIQKDFITNYINFIESKQHLIHSYWDAVTKYEIPLMRLSKNRDCFLKLSKFPSNFRKNIFFKNDPLYSILKKEGLLPFTKIKRITGNY